MVMKPSQVVLTSGLDLFSDNCSIWLPLRGKPQRAPSPKTPGEASFTPSSLPYIPSLRPSAGPFHPFFPPPSLPTLRFYSLPSLFLPFAYYLSVRTPKRSCCVMFTVDSNKQKIFQQLFRELAFIWWIASVRSSVGILQTLQIRRAV